VQQLAREHTLEAIAILVRALDSPRHCVAAAALLLERGWGKPPLVVASDEDRPLSIEFKWADADPAPAAKAAEHVVRQAIANATDDGESTDVSWDKQRRLPEWSDYEASREYALHRRVNQLLAEQSADIAPRSFPQCGTASNAGRLFPGR